MKKKTKNLQTRLYFIAAAIFLIGLCSACLLYLTAEQDADSMAINDLLNSKKYIHDLNTYGGSVTVLADKFFRWFDGLWHGEALAYTVASLTTFISLAIAHVANHLPADSRSATGGDNDRGGTNQ